MMKRFLIGTTVLLALSGCIFGGGGTEGMGTDDPKGLTVNVVDSTGAAFSADTVYWSYIADGHAAHKSAHGSDSAAKPAQRLNSERTRWRIDYPGLHGSVFIRARYSRPDSANPAFCSWTAYTQLEASAATLPATVNLVLKPAKLCL